MCTYFAYAYVRPITNIIQYQPKHIAFIYFHSLKAPKKNNWLNRNRGKLCSKQLIGELIPCKKKKTNKKQQQKQQKRETTTEKILFKKYQTVESNHCEFIQMQR